MELEYPYQLTTFLATEPQKNEPVYSGPNGWYAQLALKRRFKLNGISEEVFFRSLETYCLNYGHFTIATKSLTRPGRIPVAVVEVVPANTLMNFHLGFIAAMGSSIESRYPERDGKNYLPHITAEFDGAMVIDPNKFVDRTFTIERIWVLKDIEDENSHAYASFSLTDKTIPTK